eukprot:Gb_20444 [translate_table: standard]
MSSTQYAFDKLSSDSNKAQPHLPLTKSPASWSSPSRSLPFEGNLCPRTSSLTKTMSDLDNRFLAENVQAAWITTAVNPPDERWQERFLVQSKHPKTSFEEELLTSKSEENARSNLPNMNFIADTVSVQYPNLTAATKTYCDYLAASSDGTRIPTINHQLRPDENANTSFYARILGAMPSSTSALQRSETISSAEGPFNTAFNKRLLQLGLSNQPENPGRQQSYIDMMSTGNANFSASLFMQQSKVESPQPKYPSSYSLVRHNSVKSLSSGAIVSSPQNGLQETTIHSRSLSLPEVLRFAGRKEAENPRKLFLETSANFLGQKHFDSEAAPSVTVVVEGRSICQRISLQEHASYDSFAQAIRGMFADSILAVEGQQIYNTKDCNLSNAVPGYMIAYEDNEGDLLLAGDLSWQ